MLGMRVTCGYPSPAADQMGEELDLNKRCISNPVATYYVEADTGESMVGFGIFPGDTLVVDRSLEPKNGDIAIVLWDGGYMCKKLRLQGERMTLLSAHPDHPPILVSPESDPLVWGIVTWSFHKHVGRR